eukprot:GSMAST32.ASY1.ANO1.1588.1 assembled CDS
MSSNKRQKVAHSTKEKNFDIFSAYVDANTDSYIKRLEEAVAIRSVSAEPEKRPEVVKMVKTCQSWCKKLGATTKLEYLGMQKHANGDEIALPPVLCAQFGNDPEKKTILVYGHLDVQPAYDGKLYGRGSTDDKGPMLSFQRCGIDLPLNVKCIFEGMEESGSVGLPTLVKSLATSKEFLDPSTIDFCCISDNYWLGCTKPCLTYGLRGLSYFHLSVECSSKDLHSGVIGGSVHEAMTDLTILLSGLVDSQGRICVAGIYDDVKPVTQEEEDTYNTIDFDLKQYQIDVGVNGISNRLLHTTKKNVLMHRWRFPTLSIHGIEGAFYGCGSKTVIPRKVIAKFSLRLVPDMTPSRVNELVQAHIASEWCKLDSPNRYECIKSTECTFSFFLSIFFSYEILYLTNLKKYIFSQYIEPDLTREGGSIPITIVFEKALKKQVLLLPIGAGDDMAHSQNEKINCTNYFNGIKLLGRYLQELADQ